MNDIPVFARGITKSSRAMFPINTYIDVGKIGEGERGYYVIYYIPFLSSEIKCDLCKEPKNLEKEVIKHYHKGDLILMIDAEVF